TNAARPSGPEDDPRFAGKHVPFPGIVFAPKPVQKPHPPIWVGGESGPALRRTAQLCDAWYPIGTNPAHLLDSLARYRAGVERLRRFTAEAGRDPKSVGLAYRVAKFGESLPAKASDGERRLFSGSPADIAGDLRTMQALGVSHIDFGFAGDGADEVLAAMRRFRHEVVEKL